MTCAHLKTQGMNQKVWSDWKFGQGMLLVLISQHQAKWEPGKVIRTFDMVEYLSITLFNQLYCTSLVLCVASLPAQMEWSSSKIHTTKLAWFDAIRAHRATNPWKLGLEMLWKSNHIQAKVIEHVQTFRLKLMHSRLFRALFAGLRTANKTICGITQMLVLRTARE